MSVREGNSLKVDRYRPADGITKQDQLGALSREVTALDVQLDHQNKIRPPHFLNRSQRKFLLTFTPEQVQTVVARARRSAAHLRLDGNAAEWSGARVHRA